MRSAAFFYLKDMSLISIRKHSKAQTVVEYAILMAISLVAVIGMSSYISRIKTNSALMDHFDQVTRHIKGK